MKTFYIIAEGIGFGHISRCAILAKELEKYGKVRIVSFGTGYALAKKMRLDTIKLDFDFSLNVTENGVDIEKNIFEYIRKIKFVELAKLNIQMRKDKPYAIFVDSNIFGLIVAKLYGKSRIFYISNNNDLSVFTKKTILKSSAAALSKFVVKVPEKIFVPDFPPPYDISSKNINFFGMEKKFSFVGPLAKKIPNRGYKYNLIAMGGTKNNTQFDIFKSSKKSFVSTNLHRKNIIKINNKDYEKYFSQAKVIITHGGHNTIMEAILCGKPLLILYDGSYAERMNNAKKIAEMGLGISLDLRVMHTLVFEHALENAVKLKDNCKKFAVFANKFNGAKEIIKQIL